MHATNRGSNAGDDIACNTNSGGYGLFAATTENVPRVGGRAPLNIACNTLTYVFARMGLPPQTGGRITPELVYRATGKTEAERPGLFSAIVRHLEARWMIDDHHDLTGFGDAYKRLSANS